MKSIPEPFGRNLMFYREHFMGKCSKDGAFALMDAFYDMGGNFIDTYVSVPTHSNVYI